MNRSESKISKRPVVYQRGNSDDSFLMHRSKKINKFINTEHNSDFKSFKIEGLRDSEGSRRRTNPFPDNRQLYNALDEADEILDERVLVHKKAEAEKAIKNGEFKRRLNHLKNKMKTLPKTSSDHYEKHQEKYERAQKTLVPFIIGGSFIVMILELFYNYIMFYKTLIAVEPGLSKFYYIWALFTYILYFIGAILFYTEREFFFKRPYFFWFIAFASLVLMITSFVLEGVAVAEIKEEPKRKAAQIPVVVDMVFGILLCIFSFYFSYSLYDCHERHTEPFCFNK